MIIRRLSAVRARCAQRLTMRLAEMFAQDVPAPLSDAGNRQTKHGPAAIKRRAKTPLPEIFDVARVFATMGAPDLMHVGFDGESSNPQHRFLKVRQSNVDVHFEEQQAGPDMIRLNRVIFTPNLFARLLSSVAPRWLRQ